MWGLNGIEEIELDHGYFFHGEETTPGSIKLVGKISGENHPFVEHYRFVKQFEDENTVARQTFPAPAQLLAKQMRIQRFLCMRIRQKLQMPLWTLRLQRKQ